MPCVNQLAEVTGSYLLRFRKMKTVANVFKSFIYGGGSAAKESACNAGDLGSIPGLGRSPGEGKGYSLQYASLENSMDYPRTRKESDTTERRSRYLANLSTPTNRSYKIFLSSPFPILHFAGDGFFQAAAESQG